MNCIVIVGRDENNRFHGIYVGQDGEEAEEAHADAMAWGKWNYIGRVTNPTFSPMAVTPVKPKATGVPKNIAEREAALRDQRAKAFRVPAVAAPPAHISDAEDEARKARAQFGKAPVPKAPASATPAAPPPVPETPASGNPTPPAAPEASGGPAEGSNPPAKQSDAPEATAAPGEGPGKAPEVKTNETPTKGKSK